MKKYLFWSHTDLDENVDILYRRLVAPETCGRYSTLVSSFLLVMCLAVNLIWFWPLLF